MRKCHLGIFKKAVEEAIKNLAAGSDRMLKELKDNFTTDYALVSVGVYASAML